MAGNTILTPSDIYWVCTLPNFDGVFKFVGVISIFAAVISLIIFFVVRFGEDTEHCRMNCEASKSKMCKIGQFRWVIVWFCVAILGFTGASLIPTKNQLIAMYVIPYIVNSENVQKVPENFLLLINKKMEEVIFDLDEKGKKKTGDAADKKDAPQAQGAALSPDDQLRNAAIEAATKVVEEKMRGMKK